MRWRCSSRHDEHVVWFSGEPLRSELEAEFVETVRSKAQEWPFEELGPDDTVHWAYADGRIVEVDVQGLSCSLRTLRVMYTPADHLGRLLQSEWGDNYVFDRPADGDQLWVSGVVASARECGTWAASWLERQLRRPVARREWDRPKGGLTRFIPTAFDSVAAVEWRFLDNGECLDTRSGLAWWWLTRQPPDREISERSDRREST